MPAPLPFRGTSPALGLFGAGGGCCLGWEVLGEGQKGGRRRQRWDLPQEGTWFAASPPCLLFPSSEYLPHLHAGKTTRRTTRTCPTLGRDPHAPTQPVKLLR